MPAGWLPEGEVVPFPAFEDHRIRHGRGFDQERLTAINAAAAKDL
jgi:hypothetical protein